MIRSLPVFLAVISSLLQCLPACSQDNRVQFPSFLKKAYFGVNTGYIHYAFSQQQLEPGYAAESVHIPHFAVRIMLLGYRFNDHLSAQVSYMRPAGWIEYRNVNNSRAVHKVGMNIAGLTLRSTLPATKKLSFTGEAGIGIITRGGFILNNDTVVRNASIVKPLAGAGIGYKLNRKWELIAGFTWSPPHQRLKQPSTTFYSAGFHYLLHPLPDGKVQRHRQSGYIFPRNMLQAAITPGIGGYGANTFFSKTVPVFWGGDVSVERGVSVQYQRNVFHGRKLFSFDWGATVGWWKSMAGKEPFFTVALFPLFRFTVIRTKQSDVYFDYSLAGPAYISKSTIDGHDTGKRFTFQDFMGIGLYTGKKRQVNAGIRIVHYSNGNIFPHNDGIKVPLTFHLGFSFD